MLKHKVHLLTFKSGLKGLIIDTPKTGVVVTEIGFRAGEFLSTKEKWETAHLMEHTLLGANAYYPKARDFQMAVEQNGAYSNASTSAYDITYEMEAAHFEWQRVLGVVLDCISTPLFLESEVRSELSNVKEELISRSNNHFRHVNLALREAMGFASLTDQERVKYVHNITRDDLLHHYKLTHTLSNARFIIAGHFDGNYSEIEDVFNSRLQLESGKSRLELPHEHIQSLESPLVIRKSGVPNVYFYIDFYINRKLDDREKVAMRVLATILTDTMYSRIFGTAREKGWVYDMGSGTQYARSTTNFWIGAQVSLAHGDPLIQLIRDELIRLKNGVLEDTDFDAAKKNVLGSTMRSGQTAAGIVGRYGTFYADDDVHDISVIPTYIHDLKKQQCIQLITEMISDKTWGMGFLGSISKKIATELQNHIKEIYTV